MWWYNILDCAKLIVNEVHGRYLIDKDVLGFGTFLIFSTLQKIISELFEESGLTT